jgi:hypothetical protein
MKECRRLWDEMRFFTPARLASRLTIRSAAVAVHAAAFCADEDRTRRSLTDVQVQGSAGSRCEWNRDLLAALAHDPQRSVPAVHVEGFDVSVQRLTDPKPVQRKERDQRVLSWDAEPCLHEKAAEFVAIQTKGSGLVVDLGSADVRCRVAVEESFVVAILEQPCHRRQTSGDRGPAFDRRTPSPGRRSQCVLA